MDRNLRRFAHNSDIPQLSRFLAQFLESLTFGLVSYIFIIILLLPPFSGSIMTTAARPTFDPAKGGSGVREKSLGKLSQQKSSRDLPAHLTLKERVPGQDTLDEVNQRDLKAELEERERVAQLEKSRESQYKLVPSLEQAAQVRIALEADRDRERETEKNALLDNESVCSYTRPMICPKIINARKMAQLDADEDFGSAEFSESDLEDDDDDEDDPAELMAELNRIRRERMAEEEKREQKTKVEQVRTDIDRDDDVGSFAIKRRWDDDVPFKNCARDEPDPKRKLYVNDTLRQEFHKKFMDKYIR